MQSTVVFGNLPSVSLSPLAFRRFRRRRHVNFSLSISSHSTPLHFAVSNLPAISLSVVPFLYLPSPLSLFLSLSLLYTSAPLLVFPPLSFLKFSFVSQHHRFRVYHLSHLSFSLSPSLLLPLSCFKILALAFPRRPDPRRFLAATGLSLFPARIVHPLFVGSLEYCYLSFHPIHLPPP